MFRKGTIDDCKGIYDLICELECKQLSFDKFSNIYQKQLNSNYYCIVCEHNSHIIGVLNMRFEEQLHHADYIAEVMEFVISTSYRKKGIGKEMLTIACQRAKEYGCVQIEVACNQLRKDAHRFYEREGMRNYHYKFSKLLIDLDMLTNIIEK